MVKTWSEVRLRVMVRQTKWTCNYVVLLWSHLGQLVTRRGSLLSWSQIALFSCHKSNFLRSFNVLCLCQITRINPPL